MRLTLRRIVAAYGRHYVFLALTALVVFAPLSALEALDHAVEDTEGELFGVLPDAGVVAVALVTLVGSTLGDQFYSGLVEEAVTEWRAGHRRASVRKLVRTLPFARLIAVDLIVTAATVIGLVLFVVPGIVAFTWFSLAAPVVTIERHGVRDALRRSRELVRGNFWRVLAILGSILVITEALTEPLQAGLSHLMGETTVGDWLGAVVAAMLLAPVAALAAVTITYELMAIEGRRRPVRRSAQGM
jgi:hypothetical protein